MDPRNCPHKNVTAVIVKTSRKNSTTNTTNTVTCKDCQTTLVMPEQSFAKRK